MRHLVVVFVQWVGGTAVDVGGLNWRFAGGR